MRDALALGRRNLGATSPNPSVGALVVRDTPDGPIIVARGVTQPGGRPHAETEALGRAGEAARGATLYVSLEPCAHHGRTPPCADAVVAAGIARVVTPMDDPDPRVGGEGHARLKAAGVAVTIGVLADEAKRDHRGHVMRVTKGRPAVTLKLARTADGFGARRQGPRLHITGEAAQDDVHLMRAHADAIAVGVGTVLGDDPQLTVRLPGLAERSPMRIVFDSTLRTPRTARLVTTARDVPTLVVTGARAPDRRETERALADAGVEILRCPAADGTIDLTAALRKLAERGVARLFCEGGPTFADALARHVLIDEVVILTGPEKLGEAGVPTLGPALSAYLTASNLLRRIEARMAGADRIDIYERTG